MSMIKYVALGCVAVAGAITVVYNYKKLISLQQARQAKKNQAPAAKIRQQAEEASPFVRKLNELVRAEGKSHQDDNTPLSQDFHASLTAQLADIVDKMPAVKAEVEKIQLPLVKKEPSAIMTHFDNIYESVKTTVAFNPSWANGTGYYDHAVDEAFPDVEVGTVVKTIDQSNRRLLIIKTSYGNVVVFDRYSERNGCFVTNMPDGFEHALDIHGALELSDLVMLVGGENLPNIGQGFVLPQEVV